MQPVVRTVACPACGTPVVWQPQSRFRPFCSARCKEADIGAWASERYRVAGNDDNTEQDLNDPASSRT